MNLINDKNIKADTKMENELRKYEMKCCKTNKSVVFSAHYYNAGELDNPNRVLLNFNMPIYCSNASAECINCCTIKKFSEEFRQLEK